MNGVKNSINGKDLIKFGVTKDLYILIQRFFTMDFCKETFFEFIDMNLI